MDIIAHDNTAIMIGVVSRMMRDYESSIRMSGYEDEFGEFFSELKSHFDNTETMDPPYMERED